MPDKSQKDNDNIDIDEFMDNDKLDELRKKYAAFDGNTPTPENSDLSSQQPLAKEHDETESQDDFAEKPKTFSAQSLEELMSSFRIVYDEDNKSTALPTEAISPPSPTSGCSAPEQNEPESPPEKKENDRDYLAGMRIVYEEQEEAVVEPPLFSVEKTQQDSSADTFIETDKPTSGLADLFEHAEDPPPVKETAFKRFVKAFFPHKGDSIGEVLRKTVLIIAVLTMLVCGGILLNIYVVSPYLNSREAQKTIGLKTNSNLFAGWATAKDKYPDTDFPTGMQLKFVELFVANKDFVGWLVIPGTGIDLPVVQGKNNAEYLKKSFYGDKSKYGCCFVDTGNGITQLDRNTVIYGHNMQSDDLMLGPLENYKTIDGFKAAPLIDFSTLYKNTKWKIYAVFISNGAESGDNGYLFNYIFRNLSSDDAFSSYINQVDARKLYTTGVDILPTDKILTVSTCVYDFKDARLAVVARMVREGESEEVDLSKTMLKKNPRYPQAWYTAKGQTNPYRNAKNWFPS